MLRTGQTPGQLAWSRKLNSNLNRHNKSQIAALFPLPFFFVKEKSLRRRAGVLSVDVHPSPFTSADLSVTCSAGACHLVPPSLTNQSLYVGVGEWDGRALINDPKETFQARVQTQSREVSLNAEDWIQQVHSG